MNADTNLPNYIKSHLTHTVGIQHFIQSMSLSFVFNNFPTATAQSKKIQTQDRVFNFDTSQANLRKWWRRDIGEPTNLVLQSYGLQHDSSHAPAFPLLKYALHLGS